MVYLLASKTTWAETVERSADALMASRACARSQLEVDDLARRVVADVAIELELLQLSSPLLSPAAS
jgi:hypothetical protein